MDVQPALDLLPWDHDDPRHLTNGDPAVDFACERITSSDPRGEGPTRVLTYETGKGMPPGAVWVGDSWSKARKEILPASPFRCTHYLDIRYPERTMKHELGIIELLYERDLIRTPATVLRGWRALEGKNLVTWPDKVLRTACSTSREIVGSCGRFGALRQCPVLGRNHPARRRAR